MFEALVRIRPTIGRKQRPLDDIDVFRELWGREEGREVGGAGAHTPSHAVGQHMLHALP